MKNEMTKTIKKAKHDMRIMPWHEIYEDDVFQRRLEQIDNGYFAVINHEDGRCEIHNLKNKSKDTLCLVVEDFSEQTLNHILETRIDRWNLRKMKAHNEKAKMSIQRNRDNENFAIASEFYDEAHLISDRAELNDTYTNKHFMPEAGLE